MNKNYKMNNNITNKYEKKLITHGRNNFNNSMINSVASDIKSINASSRAPIFRRPSEEIAKPAVLVQ